MVDWLQLDSKTIIRSFYVLLTKVTYYQYIKMQSSNALCELQVGFHALPPHVSTFFGCCHIDRIRLSLFYIISWSVSAFLYTIFLTPCPQRSVDVILHTILSCCPKKISFSIAESFAQFFWRSYFTLNFNYQWKVSIQVDWMLIFKKLNLLYLMIKQTIFLSTMVTQMNFCSCLPPCWMICTSTLLRHQ